MTQQPEYELRCAYRDQSGEVYEYRPDPTPGREDEAWWSFGWDIPATLEQLSLPLVKVLDSDGRPVCPPA